MGPACVAEAEAVAAAAKTATVGRTVEDQMEDQTVEAAAAVGVAAVAGVEGETRAKPSV